MLSDFRGGGREGERKRDIAAREKHRLVAFLKHPN